METDNKIAIVERVKDVVANNQQAKDPKDFVFLKDLQKPQTKIVQGKVYCHFCGKQLGVVEGKDSTYHNCDCEGFIEAQDENALIIQTWLEAQNQPKLGDGYRRGYSGD